MKSSAMIAAMILIVIGSLIVGGYLSYMGNESHMTRKLNDSIKAFYIAEAGLEMALRQTYLDWKGLTPDDLATWPKIFKLNSISKTNFIKKPNSDTYIGTYEVSETWVIADRKKLITSTGTYANEVRTINEEIYLPPDYNAWDNVVAACGGSGGQISGNVNIMGSMYITGEEPFVDSDEDSLYDAGEPYLEIKNPGWGAYLDPTDYAFQMTGTSEIGNNYLDMPVVLKSKVPSIYDDENEWETLDGSVMVKYGRIQLAGNSRIGDPNAVDNPESKNTMNSVNVPDGFDTGGDPVGNYVYTDEILADRDQFIPQARIPSVRDAYTDHTTGTPYASPANPYTTDTVGGYEQYLSDKGFHIVGDLSMTPNSTFTYGDVTTPGANGISIDGNGNMKINGLVYIEGSLTINDAGSAKTIYYTGKGSIYVRGYRDASTDNDVVINTNIYTGSFPNNILGLMTRENILFGGANNDVMGLFYAEKTIKCTKQYDVAGTFVSTTFDLTDQVPSIFQVPVAGDPANQPPYMITAKYDSPGPVAQDWYETSE